LYTFASFTAFWLAALLAVFTLLALALAVFTLEAAALAALLFVLETLLVLSALLAAFSPTLFTPVFATLLFRLLVAVLAAF
jgi:hypothetical protein